MVPINVYEDILALKGERLPICHSGMIPWTAKIRSRRGKRRVGVGTWDADRVMAVARENAKTMYGI
jgi:TatD DNase family protein